MSTTLRLIVCVPACSMRRHLTVNSRITIDELKRYLPDPECELVFDGTMLMGKMPLTFYSLSDGATLFAVTRGRDSARAWSHITSDMDSFNDRMRIRSNPHLSREDDRLKDLKLMWLFERRGFVSKVVKIIEPRMPVPLSEKTVLTTEKVLGVEPLPACWTAEGPARV
jgi:hypothetical protein